MLKQSNNQPQEEEQTFSGFAPPTRNYFQMPNEWTDITADIESLAELKVVEYVLRHTWGYHEFGLCKTISIDEFMYGRRRADGSRMDKGTKLSRPSVIDGVKRAVEHGYLVCAIDTTDQARIKKSYALKMYGGKDLNTSKESLPPSQSSIFTPEVKDLYPSSQNSLPRSEKETLERHLEKERETPVPPSSQPSNGDSPSLSPQNSFLSSLTEEQSAFWTRWCSISKCNHESLNQTALKHVVELASNVTTTEEVQSLYDYAYDHLRALSEAKHTALVAPRLGNLIKVYPEWSQARAHKKQVQAEEQAHHEHVPGTGRLTNWTQARLTGQEPPITYVKLPGRERPTSRLQNSVGSISTDMLGQLQRLRENHRDLGAMKSQNARYE